MNELFDEVDEIIKKILLIQKDIDPSSVEKSVNLYARAFDLLFKDSEHSENILSQIKNSIQPSKVLKYVHALKSVNTLINDLENTHPLKEVLKERFLDNVNLTSIAKFEKNYLLTPKTSSELFIAENTFPNMSNTIEVRTWGTEREYSNGLRNIIDQKIRGDDVGHAAIVMRVAADHEGLRLVRHYCMNEDGKTLIPYELKKLGNDVIYEIYWSYWPGRLHTMEADYEHERRSLEYREIKELDRNVPKELSEKYIVHKYRKGAIIPLASASERTTLHPSQEVGNERARFLDLKEIEIKLKEEIETIDTMLTNYLDTDKLYSPSTSFTDKKVEKNSNFYEILKKFNTQLKSRNTAAKILYNQLISTDDAKNIRRQLSLPVDDNYDCWF